MGLNPCRTQNSTGVGVNLLTNNERIANDLQDMMWTSGTLYHWYRTTPQDDVGTSPGRPCQRQSNVSNARLLMSTANKMSASTFRTALSIKHIKEAMHLVRAYVGGGWNVSTSCWLNATDAKGSNVQHQFSPSRMSRVSSAAGPCTDDAVMSM